MGVVTEMCIKYPGGPTWIKATDMRVGFVNSYEFPASKCSAVSPTKNIYRKYIFLLTLIPRHTIFRSPKSQNPRAIS
jgi:hypothetical protein